MLELLRRRRGIETKWKQAYNISTLPSSLFVVATLWAMRRTSSTTPQRRSVKKTSTSVRQQSRQQPITPKPARSRLKLKEEKAKQPPTQPPSDHIQQWGFFTGPDPIAGWSVPLLANAVAEHKRGMFQQSGILADDMAAHPYINDCLEIRSEFLTTTPLVVTPASRGDGRRCADFVREVLPDILPLQILKDLHRTYIMMGISAAAIDWAEYRDGKDRVWLPRIKPWQPQLTYYQQFADADTVDMGALVATTLNKGIVRIDPGESRWLLFSQSRLKPWLRGAVNTLGETYLGDTFNFRDNMSFQDHFGRGITKLHHPVSWKDEEIIVAAQSLRAGGGGGVMPCPRGPKGEPLVDVDIVQADGTGFKTFESTDKRIRDRILITLLGQNMTTVGSAGGFAQARVHENGLWRKFEADAAAFGDAVLTVTSQPQEGGFEKVARQWQPRDGVIRTQICRWLALWNFGDMDLAPYVWWNCTSPEDVKEQADGVAERAKSMAAAMQSLGTCVEKLQGAGLVDGEDFEFDYLLEQTGFKLKRDDAE